MKRKYDLRNKRNFIIIIILSILIITIFSLFIYKYNHTKKLVYNIETGSVVQDVSKNYINVDDDATLKVRWNDNYYLDYQDKLVNLGKKVIVYNTINGGIKLYGKFYEIQEDGKIVENKNETILPNTTDTKFYKLDDREYLLVDRKIVSEDRSIDTANYMLVELDKMGNAKLTNNKLNLKTVAPTKLVTSKYVFDIANELLKYNKLEIDLKKIIGSSNQYKEEAKEDKNVDKKDNDSNKSDNNKKDDNQRKNNDFIGQNGNGNVVVNDNDNKGEQTTIDELKNKVKMTSVVRVQEGLSQVDIDYVIYDPYNEYKSVYVEIEKPGKVEVVYLSKTDTHMLIDNLLANTEYKLNFIYSTADSETGEIRPTKFDEMTVKTKLPLYSGTVTRINSYTTHTLTYVLNLQEGYSIDKINATVKFYYQEIDENGQPVVKEKNEAVSLDVVGNQSKVSGTIDISGYDIVSKEKATVIVNSVTGSFGTLELS